MIVTAVADLHGFLPPIGPCDVLLIAGDICPAADHRLGAQADWLDSEFRQWLDGVPAAHVVGVAGNHDFLFEQSPEWVPADLQWTYLQDSAVEVAGLKVYGTPWQLQFGGWAFNQVESELEERWARIPDGMDILVFHGPPRGFGDLTTRGESVRSPSQLAAIRRVRPRLTVFGHIHEGRGRWDIDVGGRAVTLANVTHVDASYRPVHSPIRFEINTLT